MPSVPSPTVGRLTRIGAFAVVPPLTPVTSTLLTPRTENGPTGLPVKFCRSPTAVRFGRILARAFLRASLAAAILYRSASNVGLPPSASLIHSCSLTGLLPPLHLATP